MKVNKIRNSFFLVLAALIWGVAFVAQTTGAEATGPYTFNCIRSFIGGIFGALLGKAVLKKHFEKAGIA